MSEKYNCRLLETFLQTIYLLMLKYCVVLKKYSVQHVRKEQYRFFTCYNTIKKNTIRNTSNRNISKGGKKDSST